MAAYLQRRENTWPNNRVNCFVSLNRSVFFPLSFPTKFNITFQNNNYIFWIAWLLVTAASEMAVSFALPSKQKHSQTGCLVFASCFPTCSPEMKHALRSATTAVTFYSLSLKFKRVTFKHKCRHQQLSMAAYGQRGIKKVFTVYEAKPFWLQHKAEQKPSQLFAVYACLEKLIMSSHYCENKVIIEWKTQQCAEIKCI